MEPEELKNKLPEINLANIQEIFSKSKINTRGALIGGGIGLLTSIYLRKSKLLGIIVGGLIGGYSADLYNNYMNKYCKNYKSDEKLNSE